MDPTTLKNFIDSIFTEVLILEGSGNVILNSFTSIVQNLIDTYIVDIANNLQLKNPAALLQLKHELDKFNIQHLKIQEVDVSKK